MQTNDTNKEEHDTNTRMQTNDANKWYSCHSRLFVNSCRGDSRGFSLIELLVTFSIIAIVSSIVLFNFPSFASTILLENLAHEIALVVRQAQVYGIGIKERSVGTKLFPSYGAHIAIAAGAGDTDTVIFFADANDDKGYNTGEEVERFIIQRGNRITRLCYNITTVGCTTANTLDITFKRPDPIAIIYADGALASSASITVSPPAGSQIGDRYVYVWSSGQIAVTSAE